MLRLHQMPRWPQLSLPFWLSRVTKALVPVSRWLSHWQQQAVLTIIVRTITVAFQHAADKAAENGNLTALSWLHVSSLFLQAMRIAIPAVIVAISVGTSEVQSMLNAIPEVVTGGLNIAGGMIVVVGYAMVINMMRAGYLMPFFYLGFVTAAFTNFNLVALGVIGAVMAILYIQLSPKYNRVAGAPAAAAGNNDLDNELD